MSDDEVSEFIIGRLAELVGVLLNDHVGAGADDRRVRSDSIAILMALGNWAAEHGRPDLLPQLRVMKATFCLSQGQRPRRTRLSAAKC